MQLMEQWVTTQLHTCCAFKVQVNAEIAGHFSVE